LESIWRLIDNAAKQNGAHRQNKSLPSPKLIFNSFLMAQQRWGATCLLSSGFRFDLDRHVLALQTKKRKAYLPC